MNRWKFFAASVVAGFSLMASVTSFHAAQKDLPPFQGSSRILGVRWVVDECCNWRGIWTRRGTSTIFDARYSNSNGQSLGGVINAGITGNIVRVERRNEEGGPLECIYEGRVDGNGRIKGTYRCDKTSGPQQAWSAQINY